MEGVKTYCRLSSALDAAPCSASKPHIILTKRGRYYEKLTMAAGSVALGRPWHPTTNLPDGTRAADPDAIGSVVFKNCWMDSHNTAEAWERMSGRDKNGMQI